MPTQREHIDIHTNGYANKAKTHTHLWLCQQGENTYVNPVGIDRKGFSTEVMCSYHYNTGAHGNMLHVLTTMPTTLSLPTLKWLQQPLLDSYKINKSYQFCRTEGHFYLGSLLAAALQWASGVRLAPGNLLFEG